VDADVVDGTRAATPPSKVVPLSSSDLVAALACR